MQFSTRQLVKVSLLCIAWSLIALTLSFVATTQHTVEKLSKNQPTFAHVFPKKQRFLFPDGTTKLYPGQKLVALYGTPNAPVLGALGQQPCQQAIDRVKQLAASYQPYISERILPTFEVIATIASSSPTENGDYSQEQDINMLQSWVSAAKTQGVYVVLDLQPGRSDFLTQAKQYEPLFKEPNVGLALDPEWRLGPQQKPLEQIGSVDINEVNATANWLADLTAQLHLPQKLFLLHEFKLDMLPNREALNTSHTELAYTIQMDGQGTSSMKADTWRAVTTQPPTNTAFGWKNFYVKDTPMLDPAQTMQNSPKPSYISYQ